MFILLFRCLRTLYPSICPLCRKEFRLSRAKKLHVDTAPDEPDGARAPLESHSADLLRRIVMVSGENAPDEDVLEVLRDVSVWLSAHGNDLNLVSHYCAVEVCYVSITTHERYAKHQWHPAICWANSAYRSRSLIDISR